MIEVALQLTRQYALVPSSAEDLEKIKNYRPNQIVRAKVVGVKKQRSIRQLNLYWACCSTVAQNTQDPKWNTKEKVDFNCRVGCGLKDHDYIAMTPEGYPQFKYLSISFKNLGHVEACDYFNKAMDHMAAFLGVSTDKLIRAAQDGMVG